MERYEGIGGLETIHVAAATGSRATVVVLHGYAMRPDDLAPFARSIGLAADFYLPQAPLDAVPAGKTWWPIDQERRARALERGPRDLKDEHPADAAVARGWLAGLVAALRERHGDRPLVLAGFSQGGMLACDAFLRGDVDAEGLALLSSSRISLNEWEPLAARLEGLPVLLSHGVSDTDLAFSAGEGFRDFCSAAGADVTWVPFEGGHEIPLVVWRALKRLLRELR